MSKNIFVLGRELAKGGANKGYVYIVRSSVDGHHLPWMLFQDICSC